MSFATVMEVFSKSQNKLFDEIVPDDGHIPPWLRVIYIAKGCCREAMIARYDASRLVPVAAVCFDRDLAFREFVGLCDCITASSVD